MLDLLHNLASSLLAIKHGPFKEQYANSAMQAVVVLRLTLPAAAVDDILTYAARLQEDTALRYHVALAAAGWSGPRVEAFLDECAIGRLEYARQAALATQQKRYLTWQPL